MHRNGICMAEDCEEPRRRSGPKTLYCNVHYRRMRTTGRLDLKSAEECYEDRVDRSGGPDACHPWTAGLNSAGYGTFGYDGEMYATRWAYKRFVGSLAKLEVIRHTCDNPPCQNRRHWVKGTQADNIQDMVDRGRVARGEGKRTQAKLTKADVREIRSSTERTTDLARRFGVSSSNITGIRSGYRWEWLR